MKLSPGKIVAPIVVGLVLLALHNVIGSSTISGQATRVLGQLDFTHASPDFDSPIGFNSPSGLAIDKSVTPNRPYLLERQPRAEPA
jgi:hypothetical protein